MDAQLPTSPDPWVELRARRRRRRPWAAALIVAAIGVIPAVLWFALEGLPFTDHARYGSVAVPGSGQIELPAGDIRLFFQESDLSSDEGADVPEGLEVTVVGPDGRPVAIGKLFSNVGGVSINIFSSQVDDVGHVPYGKMDVPQAGTYAVTAIEQAGPVNASAPTVTVGEPPLNPFGPPIVGAAVILAPFLIVAVLLLLFWRR